MDQLFLLFDRAKEKWLRYYRLCVFRAKTGQGAEKCKILGKMTQINPNVRVGRNVTFYPNVMLFGDGPIEIGEDVWIAANCQIIKGARIESGAVIGAGSVVKDRIPSCAIAVGSPAKVQKYRQ